MTLADWFTPRRRQAESHRCETPTGSPAAQEVETAPECHPDPERGSGPLRAPRGREFWLVANGRGDVWDFDTEHAAESWAHGRAAVDGELVVWRTWAEGDA